MYVWTGRTMQVLTEFAEALPLVATSQARKRFCCAIQWKTFPVINDLNRFDSTKLQTSASIDSALTVR